MRCPTLSELPPPPPGKTGWPWTEESPQLPDTMPDGSPWPKISIVTPNYNYGKFLEETIRSVLLQGYPNLEYIIIDGGSTDNSVEIIKKYEPWLAYWVSEPDEGQAHAINKGLQKTTGEIVAWLNSDDMYTKNSISKAAQFIIKSSNVDIVYGDCLYIDSKGKKLKKFKTAEFDQIKLFLGLIPQPSTFFKRKLLKYSYINESLNYTIDNDLWLKYNQKATFKYIPTILSYYRLHPSSKSIKKELLLRKEQCEVSLEHLQNSNIPHKSREELSRIITWKLGIINWIIGDIERAKKYLEQIEVKDISNKISYIQEAIFTFIQTGQAETMSKYDIKHKELLIKNFHKYITHITGCESYNMLKNLLSQYYLTLALERKDITLLLIGLSKDPIYLIRLLAKKLNIIRNELSYIA